MFRGFTPLHAQASEDSGFFLLESGSAILGSDCPQSNNSSGQLHSSHVRDILSHTLLPVVLRLPRATSVPVL